MPPLILPIEDETALARAVELIRAGQLIIFPTDTFYALGADPYNAAALDALYRLKGRPEDKPVLLLIADRGWAERLWEGIGEETRALMDRFWPGPLTLVALPGVGAPPLPTGRGLALRVPGNPLCRALLASAGVPLTGTSANQAGRPPARSAVEAAACFPRGVALVLDGGTYQGAEGSTLVDVTGGDPVVLREGRITREELKDALGKKH